MRTAPGAPAAASAEAQTSPTPPARGAGPPHGRLRHPSLPAPSCLSPPHLLAEAADLALDPLVQLLGEALLLHGGAAGRGRAARTGRPRGPGPPEAGGATAGARGLLRSPEWRPPALRTSAASAPARTSGPPPRVRGVSRRGVTVAVRLRASPAWGPAVPLPSSRAAESQDAANTGYLGSTASLRAVALLPA